MRLVISKTIKEGHLLKTLKRHQEFMQQEHPKDPCPKWSAMNVTKEGITGTNVPDFVIEQLQLMGEAKTLKEVKDKTLTMPTKEEVMAEEGEELPELMEMAVVDVPTIQVQLLRKKRMIMEEFTQL